MNNFVASPPGWCAIIGRCWPSEGIWRDGGVEVCPIIGWYFETDSPNAIPVVVGDGVTGARNVVESANFCRWVDVVRDPPSAAEVASMASRIEHQITVRNRHLESPT